MPKPGSIRMIAGWALVAIGLGLTASWAIGAAASDRWWWSQWLSWIPAIILLPAGLSILVGGLLQGRSWKAVGIATAIAGPIIFIAERWSPVTASAAASIRILQWTAGPPRGNAEPFARFIVDTNADITIVEGARAAAAEPLMRAWATDHTLAMRGQFLIASKLPITRLQTVAWARDIMLIAMEVTTPSGPPLRLLIVDLPSAPNRSRAEVIHTAHELLERLERQPDLVLGDFNLTQDSWQLRRFLPGYKPAWRLVGEGWGGTWPRTMPIYRLDHVLASNGRPPQSITTIDPQCGGHRAQLIDMGIDPVTDQGAPPSPSQ